MRSIYDTLHPAIVFFHRPASLHSVTLSRASVGPRPRRTRPRTGPGHQSFASCAHTGVQISIASPEPPHPATCLGVPWLRPCALGLPRRHPRTCTAARLLNPSAPKGPAHRLSSRVEGDSTRVVENRRLPIPSATSATPDAGTFLFLRPPQASTLDDSRRVPHDSSRRSQGGGCESRRSPKPHSPRSVSPCLRVTISPPMCYNSPTIPLHHAPP